MNEKIRVPVLLGPTASGKTAIALALAEKYNLKIISCDSRQIYQFMNVGTAKPSADDLARVKHYLIDCIKPSEFYSAFRFAEDAADIIRKEIDSGSDILICGGTGLYFKCLSEGIGPQEEADPIIREELTKRAESCGSKGLHDELMEKDPLSGKKIHANDLQRILRALGVFYQTGKPISSLQNETKKQSEFSFEVIKLNMDRNMLYERINNRVDSMIKNGLIDEFQSLVAMGYGESTPGLQTVGYRELFPCFKNEYTLDTAIEKIKQNTRRFAKRQITWFSHQTSGITIDSISFHDTIKQIDKMIKI
jgi:tRNA dimethylallyltransferase